MNRRQEESNVGNVGTADNQEIEEMMASQLGDRERGEAGSRRRSWR
jgi:hypothetical protein